MDIQRRKEALEAVKLTMKNLNELKGLTPRASQNQMISAVAKQLLDRAEKDPEDGSHLQAIEAPTGTGKSFGYLLPAVPIALSINKKVVVSTAVVSLQEQLIKKDLPALAEAMPIPFKYALAKGRSRFVCNTRLEKQKLAYEDLGFKNDGSFSVGADSSQADDADLTMMMHSALESGAWNGEFETLNFGKDQQKKNVWPKITTDSSGCSGRSCSAYKKCAYFKAKDLWMNADVIVANHDLVMSALAVNGEGGSLLPRTEETFFIFDEGHHVPAKARDAFAFNFKTETFKKLPKEAASFLNDLEEEWRDESCAFAKRIATTLKAKKKTYQDDIKSFNKTYETFVDMVKTLSNKASPKEPYVVPYTNEPEVLTEIISPLLEDAEAVFAHVSDAFDDVSNARKELFKVKNTSSIIMDDTEYNRVAGALGFYKNRFSNLCATLANFMKEQPKVENPPYAKWITPDEKGKDYLISFSPTMATDILPSNLYDRAYGVLYTSATMTSVGGFQLFMQKTGMSYYKNARTLKLDSPFDFKKNATLVFGDVGGDVKNVEHHTKRLYEVIPYLLEEYDELGNLILFTSKSQMEQVVQKLPYHIRSLCKVQYTMPNGALIEQHKADIDAGKKSILIGTQSFSEGLDLPGAWCSLVLCTKLPFSVPDNPIDKTLTAWLESQGRNVFKEIAVPEAAERLIQQSGRLLRREEDTGKIIMLDNRLIHKWSVYGRLLVEAMPPFGRKKLDLTKVKYEPKPVELPKHDTRSLNSTNIPELYNYDNEFKDFIF